MSGLTGGWSKYGGARQSPLKQKLDKEWACQSCGKMFAPSIRPLLFGYVEGEYLRVCATCFNNGCKDFMARRLQTQSPKP